MRKIILLLFISLMISSCGSNRQGDNQVQPGTLSRESLQKAQVRSADRGQTSLPDVKRQHTQKLIKDGNMKIEVEDVIYSRSLVDSIIEKHDGYLSNERFENVEKYKRYYLVIRIPSDKFESFLSELEKGVGEVVSRSIQARDVTEEYIDLETRLENKREYLGRYQELLDKANSVEEMLKIQEQIRQLEEEIESVTGRLKYLDNQVDYSTLNLTLEEEKPYTFSPARELNLPDRLKGALVNGWNTFVRFLLGVVYLWPFIAAGLIAWVAVRQYRKRGRSSE